MAEMVWRTENKGNYHGEGGVASRLAVHDLETPRKKLAERRGRDSYDL